MASLNYVGVLNNVTSDAALLAGCVLGLLQNGRFEHSRHELTHQTDKQKQMEIY